MLIYVVSPAGVYSSLERAKTAWPGAWEEWSEDHWYRDATDEERVGEIRHAEIHALELEAGDDPLVQFALALLARDPVALDAAKDVLKC